MGTNEQIMGKLNQDIRLGIDQHLVIVANIDSDIVKKLKSKE